MVRECVVPECSTHARFNHPGETHGVFCSKHKEDGMRNVVHKPCTQPGCETLAVFNHPNASTGLYCGQHKPPGFINVKDRKCKYPECMRMPNFNFAGEKGGLYCSQHKQEGMIDIKHKRCMFPDCPKRPSFNFTGEMRALYCGTHKQDGMVNVDQERRSCNRAKMAEGDDGSGSAKRQRASNGYAEKMAGYALKDTHLGAGGGCADAAGAPQAFDCSTAGQQAVEAALGAYAAGSDPSAVLLPGLPAGQQQQQGAADGQYVQSGASVPYLTEELAQAVAQVPQALPGFVLMPQWPRTESLPEQQPQPAGPPQLPSPSLLRGLLGAETSPSGKEGPSGGGAAAEPDQAARPLAHLMHSHLVDFLRDSLRRSEGAAEDKDKVCVYIDTFTTWQPDKRVEQYALLHFDWDVAGEGEKWRAVLSRMDKALSSDVAP